jgi:probable poly-beta-1,6-N-acetyl-D-glucosamine export protein
MQATAGATIDSPGPAPAARSRADRRLPELDLLRAAALLAVVFIHAASWIPGGDASPQAGPYAAAIALARFCVPALVLASGFALHRAYGRPANAREFLRRRALRILVPWLVWVPVYAAVDLVAGKVKANPHDLAVWLAYGPGHLYFLLLVAQLAPLLPFLPADRRRLALLAGAAVAVQLALDVVRTYATLPTDGAIAWPVTFVAHMEAPFWIGWFLLGCLLSAGYEGFRAGSTLWPVALGVAVLGGGAVLAEATMVPGDQWRQGTDAFLWPSRLPATLGVVALLLWAGRDLAAGAGPLWRPVRSLSQRSLGVYVIHVAVLEGLAHTPLVGLPAPARLTVLLLGSLGIAWVLAVLLARTAAGALALGELPRPVRMRSPAAG